MFGNPDAAVTQPIKLFGQGDRIGNGLGGGAAF